MKCAFITLAFTIGIATLLSLTARCYADVFGPEAPIVLPPISAAQLRSFEEQMQRLIPKVKPSCVEIQNLRGVPSGSGVIFDSKGLILTHGHGEQKPGDRVKLTFGDGRQATGRYVGVHRDFDLSIISIDTKGSWPAVDIASAAKAKVGELCFAFSFPTDFNRRISPAAVLRMSRVVEVDPRSVYSSLAIRPGDSGGPMFNADGQIIGICQGTDGFPNAFSYYARADLLTQIQADLMNGALISHQHLGKEVAPEALKGLPDSPGESATPPELQQAMKEIAARQSPATVVIVDRKTKRQVGNGVIISPSGLVLTHGTGLIGPKRIGMTFDIRLANAKRTTGKYLGIHRGYRVSLMQLDGDASWPAAKIGNPDKLKPGDPCAMLSYPPGYYKTSKAPLMRFTRALAVTRARIHTPVDPRMSEVGAPLYALDGTLVGVKDRSQSFVRADLLDSLKAQLLAGEFTPRFRYPYPFSGLKLNESMERSRSSVVLIKCNDRQVAFGLVVSPDGNIVTKGSAVISDRAVCEFADGRTLEATLVGRSYQHDLALLDVEANELPIAAWNENSVPVGTIVTSLGIYATPIGAGVAGSDQVSVTRDKGQLGFDVASQGSSSKGVDVTNVRFALTREVLQPGDTLTEFDGKSMNNVNVSRETTKQLLESDRAFAGERFAATVLRNGQRVRVMIPIELGDEHDRSRPVQDSIAPLLPDGLQGRHNGFPNVFVHDAMIRTRTERDTIIGPTVTQRTDLGSPIVDLSGRVIGLNIASHEGTFTYAVPATTILEAIKTLRKTSKAQ